MCGSTCDMRSFSRRSPCSHSWSMLIPTCTSGATARRVSRGGATSSTWPAGWRLARSCPACSINSRWAAGAATDADTGPGDSSANSSRSDSGAREAVCRTPLEPDRGLDAGRFVGGRSCGAMTARTATGTGAQEASAAFPFMGSSAPAPAPGFCATAWLATGLALTAAASPRTAQPAVQAPAPIGARAPFAHPLRSALPAAQPAWFGQRNRGPDRGRDPDRRCGARYGILDRRPPGALVGHVSGQSQQVVKVRREHVHLVPGVTQVARTSTASPSGWGCPDAASHAPHRGCPGALGARWV